MKLQSIRALVTGGGGGIGGAIADELLARGAGGALRERVGTASWRESGSLGA